MKVAVNDTHLNVIEQGSGPVCLVFMHYFGGSALEWQSVMNQLSDRYRCIAIDLRGHGDSATAATYTVDDMADDVICVVQELSVQDFVLVGHSMSGKVALVIAAGTPNQPTPPGLQSLLLVSPSPPVPEPIPDDERQKLLKGYGQRSRAEGMLKNITAKPVLQAISEQIIADDLRTAKSAWNAWLLQGSKEDITDRMDKVSVPVHIIVGSEDRALLPDVQNRLVLPYLKNATLELALGAGHLLPWEIPTELSGFVLKNLSA